MPKAKSSRIPSPARSLGGLLTPRRQRPSRRTSSVGAPTTPARLSSIVEQFKEQNMNSFALSPMDSRVSILSDNTEIEQPRRKSWWKKLDDNSRDMQEVLEGNQLDANNVVMEYIDVEILSQEKKNYTLDLPESSGSESIDSIVIPQRKLFTQKNVKPQKNFGKVMGSRESITKATKASAEQNVKNIEAGTKTLFNKGTNPKNKPSFPAALLISTPNKTLNKSKELTVPEVKGQVRSLFGNRAGGKRKNMFADFIVSESEDEISDIQPKVFRFNKSSNDLEMDDWKLLPSSTMAENQLDTTPAGPVRESTGVNSDGPRNSSAEGSGWDSHRITKQTLRQTFGKDLTPRKSLRALVMQKAATRQTAFNEANAELNVPNPKSMALDDASVHYDHVVSDIRSMAVDNVPMHYDDDIQEELDSKIPDPKSMAIDDISVHYNDDIQKESDHVVSDVGSPAVDDVPVQYDDDIQEESDNEVPDPRSTAVDDDPVPDDDIQEESDNDVPDPRSPAADDDPVPNIDDIQEESDNEVPDPTSTAIDDDPVPNIDDIQEESDNEVSDPRSPAVDDDPVPDDDDIQKESDNEVSDQRSTAVDDDPVPDDDDIQKESDNEVPIPRSMAVDDDPVPDDDDIQEESDNEVPDPRSTEVDKDLGHSDDDIQEESDNEVSDARFTEVDIDLGQSDDDNQEESDNEVSDARSTKVDNDLGHSDDDNQEESDNEVSDARSTEVDKDLGHSDDDNQEESDDEVSDARSTEVDNDLGQSDDDNQEESDNEVSDARSTEVDKDLGHSDDDNQEESDNEVSDAGSIAVDDIPMHYDDDIQEESNHEVSIRTRQTTLEMYLQKIKNANMEKRNKINEAVKASLSAPLKDVHVFKVPFKPALRRAAPKAQSKAKVKPNPPTFFTNCLPKEVIEDMKYKPPKRFQPRNAPWITKRLYSFLESKLESKYDYKARVRAEKLVETIYNFIKVAKRHEVAPFEAVSDLKAEMAALGIVRTHFEFYEFFHDFLPRAIRVKVNPDVVNNIPAPKNGIFSNILPENTSRL